VVRPETPATSQDPSENDSTQPTTPSSVVPPRSSGSASTVRPSGKIVPVIPSIPSLSRPARKDSISNSVELKVATVAEDEKVKDVPEEVAETPKPSSPQAKTAPKSWADLVRSKNASSFSQVQTSAIDGLVTNGASKSTSLADILNNFSVRSNNDEGKLSFLKPRGLVNTGNMCYMNSVSPRLN
jgi:ubiquitin carboxyl-terminal hydrolase 10